MSEKNRNVKIENHGVIPKEEEHATPEELYARLLEKIKKYHPSSDEVHMIEKAYIFARNAHGDQRRKSGEPYIITRSIRHLFWLIWSWIKNLLWQDCYMM